MESEEPKSTFLYAGFIGTRTDRGLLLAGALVMGVDVVHGFKTYCF